MKHEIIFSRRVKNLGHNNSAALVKRAAERALEARPCAEATTQWTHLLDLAESWQPVALPVRGADVLALGVPPGPRVGEVLAQVEQWWEGQDYRPGRDDCLDRLRLAAS